MKRVIALIGLPGAGKTTLGRALAGRLGARFLDLDELVTRISGRSIPELFEAGEECFRDAEAEALSRVFAENAEPVVLATGGGAVLREENRRLLREKAFTVFLDRPAANIARDVDTSGRPLLAGGAKSLFALEARRRALYLEAADARADCDADEATALSRLIECVRSAAE